MARARTATVTVCVPAFAPSVHDVEAMPSAPVVTLALLTEPPPLVTLQVTLWPDAADVVPSVV